MHSHFFCCWTIKWSYFYFLIVNTLYIDLTIGLVKALKCNLRLLDVWRSYLSSAGRALRLLDVWRSYLSSAGRALRLLDVWRSYLSSAGRALRLLDVWRSYLSSAGRALRLLDVWRSYLSSAGRAQLLYKFQFIPCNVFVQIGKRSHHICVNIHERTILWAYSI